MQDKPTIVPRPGRGVIRRPDARKLAASVALLMLLPALGCDDGSPAPGTPGTPDAESAPVTPPAPAAFEPAVPDRAATATASPAPVADPEAPWTVPEGWTVDPEPRPMRLATFRALSPGDTGGGTEIAVSRFNGDVGGELANVNRWRGQVGLDPIDAAGLEAELTRFGDLAAPGYAVRASGDLLHLFAAGVYDPARDASWFVRVMGTPDAIDAVEAEVMDFARSISSSLAGG